MSATFISYRRNDSAGHTGRLYDHLCKALGEESVFRDIDTIKPGTDFVQAVREGIECCSSLIVVIGNQWLTAKDDSGRRLDHPLDYVRLEIASALKQGIQVIPVLVEGAKMPDPEDLPDEISTLARLQALQLSDDRWDYDVGRLIAALDNPTDSRNNSSSEESTALNIPKITTTNAPTTRTDSSSKSNRYWLVGTVAILLILLGGVTQWTWPEKTERKMTVPATERKIIQKERPASSQREVIEAKTNQKSKEELAYTPDKRRYDLQQMNHIAQLLDQAEQNISNLQLSAPRGNNAVEKYKEILNLQPGHPEALLGLDGVTRKYTELARQAISTSNLKKASTYLKLAKSINPDIPEILQAEKLLKSEQSKNREEKSALALKNNMQKETQPNANKLFQIQLACKNSCKSAYGDCKKLAAREEHCSSNHIKTKCGRIQKECLQDPQIILTWGEFASNAECRERYNQCAEDIADKCKDAETDSAANCIDQQNLCLKTC